MDIWSNIWQHNTATLKFARRWLCLTPMLIPRARSHFAKCPKSQKSTFEGKTRLFHCKKKNLIFSRKTRVLDFWLEFMIFSRLRIFFRFSRFFSIFSRLRFFRDFFREFFRDCLYAYCVSQHGAYYLTRESGGRGWRDGLRGGGEGGDLSIVVFSREKKVDFFFFRRKFHVTVLRCVELTNHS